MCECVCERDMCVHMYLYMYLCSAGLAVVREGLGFVLACLYACDRSFLSVTPLTHSHAYTHASRYHNVCSTKEPLSGGKKTRTNLRVRKAGATGALSPWLGLLRLPSLLPRCRHGPVCMCVCVRVYVRTRTCVCVHARACVVMVGAVYVCARAVACVYMNACVGRGLGTSCLVRLVRTEHTAAAHFWAVFTSMASIFLAAWTYKQSKRGINRVFDG